MTLQAKITAKITVSSLCGVLILGAFQGCEDAAAKQRDEVQRAIRDASRELQMALATSGVTGVESAEDLAAKQQKLSGIVQKLSGGSGGEPGQNAAKSMLTASAQHELAGIRLSQAGRIETTHQAMRNQMREKLDAIQSMNALAAGIESADAKAEREQLETLLEGARNRAAELTDKVKQLDGPINEQSSLNAASQKEVDALTLEVASLRRKADELGHADGFETYKQSAAIKRDADKIEYDISQREIELDYTLTPEHKLADSQLKRLQEMTESVQAALDLLKTFSQTSASAVKDIRARISSYTDEVTKGLDAIARSTSEDLKPFYDDALDSLEKAAKQSESATRAPAKGDDVQAARLLAARIHESRGNAYWSQARGASDQVDLIKSLEKAGAGKSGDAMATATAAHKEAIDQAKAEYATAQELLTQVQSRENQAAVDGYRESLERAADALSGKIAEDPAPSAEASASSEPSETETAAPRASAVAAGPVGFDTPEELIQKFQEIVAGSDSFSNKMRALLGMTRTETADAKKARTVTLELASSFGRFVDALNAKFGVEATDATLKAAGMNQALPSFSEQNIVDRTDDRVTIEYQKPDGKTGKQHLVKAGDKWYADGDEIEEDEKQQLAMMTMMMPLMKKAVQTVVPKINAGEFSTPEEAMKALQAAMVPNMGGGPPRAGVGK